MRESTHASLTSTGIKALYLALVGKCSILSSQWLRVAEYVSNTFDIYMHANFILQKLAILISMSMFSNSLLIRTTENILEI